MLAYDDDYDVEVTAAKHITSFWEESGILGTADGMTRLTARRPVDQDGRQQGAVA